MIEYVSASLDLASGTSVKAVAARLGRSDSSITLRTHAHLLPHEEIAAVEQLGVRLSTKTSSAGVIVDRVWTGTRKRVGMVPALFPFSWGA